MKRNRIVTLLSLLLTLCLLAAIPAANAETGAAGLEIDTEESVLSAPVDDAVLTRAVEDRDYTVTGIE